MRRYWIVTVVVIAMLLSALPVSAGKPPGTPGKPPPNQVTPQYEVTMDFVAEFDGLSTTADPDCGPADFIVMDWDGRNLGAAFEPAGEPYVDVMLGAGLAWYRDYPYFATPADVPADFDPGDYPFDPQLTGDGITGCHGAGIAVYRDYYLYNPDEPDPQLPDMRIGDHQVNLKDGLFRLCVSDGTVELLWHSDYYTEFQKVKKRWRAPINEDFTYSGGLSWTTGPNGEGVPVVWDPDAPVVSGYVSGDLNVSYFWPGSYTPFPGSPRPVEFILTVTPHNP
jgi:hypothetical protein